jgi:dTDP-4-dehydrorhamnose reductase
VVHFSTDYVFGGENNGLRREDDAAVPVSVYGRSKLAGERAVLAHPGNCVLRVSWVSGPDKASFIDSIFDAALAGRPLAAVADKFSLPTFTGDLAEWLDALVERQASGIFHACNSGEPITWHDLATAACEEMAGGGLISEVPEIRKQTLAECTFFRAERPRFTAMDTRRLADVLGRTPRHWREALAEHIRFRGSLI